MSGLRAHVLGVTMQAMLAPQAARRKGKPPSYIRNLRSCRPVVDSRDREPWLAARKTGVGASDVAAILGLSPWKSPFSLYMEITGQVSSEERSPEAVERMSWGVRLEASIAEEYASRTGTDIKLCGWLLRSKKYPAILATPDFVEFDVEGRPSILEVKNVTERSAPHWENGAPEHYLAQIQQQLLVTGLARGTLAALVGGDRLTTVSVDASHAFQRVIVERAMAFWKLVEDRTPPAPDDSISTSRTLQRMLDDKQSIDLPDEVLAWHLAASAAADDEAAAKKRKDEYKRKIMAFLGSAAEGVLPGGLGRYTFQTVNRSGYTVHPESFRQLRFLPPRKGDRA